MGEYGDIPMRHDNRYVAELPSGFIKNPKLHIAGDDFGVNDVVYLDGDTVFPMCDGSKDVYGVIAAKGVKGSPVLVAAKREVQW